MTASVAEAYDAMLEQFATVWGADSISEDVAVQYPDRTDFPEQLPANAWARVTITHNPGIGGQSSLSGDTGVRRYNRVGVIEVQIFTPIGGGMTLAHSLVAIARRCFEGVNLSPSGVWFRGVRHTEVGSSGAWTQNNVLATFEYDEIR